MTSTSAYKMIDKNPENIRMISYMWMFALATFGGTVAYLRKLKNGKKWSTTDYLIEIVTAAFAGMIMFFLCHWAGIDDVGTAALTGISGRFSSRSLFLMGEMLDKVFLKFLMKFK